MFRDLAARFLRRRHEYRAVFGTPEGRRVLDDILKKAGVGQPVHAPGDPHQTAFRDGRRTLALEIARMVNMREDEATERANQLQRESIHD